MLTFDTWDTLGVTGNHPIYSVSYGSWRMAGELVIGEEVLTKSGKATVMSSVKKIGSETVYNLEVKELHNFLVGSCGVVVHNNYFPDAKQLAKVLGISTIKIHDVKKLMLKRLEK